MSFLAAVIVYDCDDCQTVVGLKEDNDWEKFEREWYPGLLCQFCPECRNKFENQAAMRADKLAEQRFDERHKKIVRTYGDKSFGKTAVV